MSVDFQVVLPKEIIPLTSVQSVPGLLPRTLDIGGIDFSTGVDQVLLNGLESPDVVVVSRTRLLAQVPDALTNITITSVTVISIRLGATKRSVIAFEVGQTASKVNGILRLMQIFLKVLLTTPGRDIFSPRVGGGGLKNLGLTFGRGEGGNVVSDFIVSVNNTQRQIVAIQARDPTIPPSERLLSAKVTTAAFNRTEEALVVGVELTSQAGSAATANLLL